MNRSVLVTGGSKGIGLAIAQAMAADGDKVAVTYHTSEPPDGLFAVKCDVSDPASVNEAFTAVEAEHGNVQVLVFCAGITRDKMFLLMKPADFTDVIDTNLTGAFLCAQRATKGMLALKEGRMIFVSSVAGSRGEAGQANYTASKAGLLGMARSLARELGARKITANVVAPGMTNTDMLAKLKPERIAEMAKQIPLQRVAEPAEIASAVRYLASPEASYITGAYLPVDGGAAMGH